MLFVINNNIKFVSITCILCGYPDVRNYYKMSIVHNGGVTEYVYDAIF